MVTHRASFAVHILATLALLLAAAVAIPAPGARAGVPPLRWDAHHRGGRGSRLAEPGGQLQHHRHARRRQHLQLPGRLRFRAHPAARPGGVLEGLRRRPDLHLHPRQERHLARREALHLRRREVLPGRGARQAPPARRRGAEGGGLDRDPHPVHRGPQAEVPVRSADEVPRERGIHHRQAPLREHRHPEESRQREADRDRALRLQGVEARQPLDPRAEPELLQEGEALPGPDHRQGRPGRQLAHDRLRGQGDRLPLLRQPPHLRGLAVQGAAGVRRQRQGARGRPVRHADGLQPAEGPVQRPEGPPGHRPRHRQAVHRGQGRLRAGHPGDGPDPQRHPLGLHRPT